MEKISDNIFRSVLRTPLFEGIGRTEAEDIIETLGGELLTLTKGDTITEIKEAENAGNIFLILSGMAQLVRYGIHGERYLIDYSFDGSVLGYVGCLSERYLFNSSYIAGRDSVILRLLSPEICSIPEDSLIKLERNLLRIISDKYARLLQKGDITTRRFVRDKILTYLSYESQLRGSAVFEIPLNRQELADYLCVDRTTLSTELSQLQDKGIIKKHKGHFELLETLVREE